jgi:hypothetical protein
MITISELIRSYAPAFPEISRDKISQAAQSAIKQLPWIAGTLAVYTINFYTSGLVTLLFPLAAFAASSYAGLICLSDMPADEKTQKLQQILKISLTAFAILGLSVALSRCITTLPLFQQLLQQPLISSDSLLKMGSIYVSLFMAKMIASQGFSMKNYAQDDLWLEKIGVCYLKVTNEGAKGSLHRAWAYLDQTGYASYVPTLQKMMSQSIAKELVDYLRENPDNLERAKILFPTIFTYQDDFQTLLEILPHFKVAAQYDTACKTIKDYFIQEFSPFVSEASPKHILDAAGKASQDSHQLHLAIRLCNDYLDKLKTLKDAPIVITLTQKQALKGDCLPEENLGAQLIKIGTQAEALEGNIRRILKGLQDIRQDWIKQHLENKTRTRLDHIFDELGFTVGDYHALARLIPKKTDVSSRQRVVNALNDRAVYCLEDLIDKKLMSGDKTAFVEQLARFIEEKPLEDLPNIDVTPISKISRVAAAFFNIALTTVGLGLQFAGAPWITGFGVAYGFGFRQGAVNPFGSYRFPQASLYFPQSLKQKASDVSSWIFSTMSAYNTETKIGKSFAFFFAANQGETLRDYLDQTI